VSYNICVKSALLDIGLTPLLVPKD